MIYYQCNQKRAYVLIAYYSREQGWCSLTGLINQYRQVRFLYLQYVAVLKWLRGQIANLLGRITDAWVQIPLATPLCRLSSIGRATGLYQYVIGSIPIVSTILVQFNWQNNRFWLCRFASSSLATRTWRISSMVEQVC